MHGVLQAGHPQGRSHSPLEMSLRRLSSASTTKFDQWELCSVEDRTDTSKNAVRSVFFRDDKLLRSLFRAVQATRMNGQDQLPAWLHNDGEQAFYRHVVGEGVLNSRAKILATILLEGEQYLLQVWDRLLETLGPSDSSFTDQKLPFDSEAIYGYLGTASSSNFCENQHKFCPVDSRQLDVDFELTRYKLRQRIFGDATIVYNKRDDHGTGNGGVAYRWNSLSQLQNIFKDQHRRVKALYIGLRKLEGALPKRLPELREHYQTVLQHADRFYAGLASRERCLAILIYASVPSQAPAWKRFTDHCLAYQPLDASNTTVLNDELLPLTLEQAVEHLEDDETFYKYQPYCCPIKLKLRESSSWSLEGPPILPLLGKSYIDKGNFGSVYRVRVAKGYFDDLNEVDLAMKVIEAGSKFRYTEWTVAERANPEESSPGRLLLPVAMVRAASEIFLFMPLAECNLETLMRGTKRRERATRTEEQVDEEITESERELEDHCRSLVPTNYNERLDMLRLMIGLSEALRKLHFTFWTGSVYHGDVKTSNILYTRSREYPLQLSDFGISMIKHPQLRETQDGMTYGQLSQLPLSSACPNFPPEADSPSRLVDGKADMWGFGIVFAEFVSWMSGGPSALTEFKRMRERGLEDHEDRHEPRSYYRTDDGNAKLKDGYERWFNDLIRKTQAKDEKGLYTDCWHLLRDGLLTCDPEQRLDADRTCRALRHIRSRRSPELNALLGGVSDEGAHSSTDSAQASSGDQLVRNDSKVTVQVQTEDGERPKSMTESNSTTSMETPFQHPNFPWEGCSSASSASAARPIQSEPGLMRALKDRDSKNAAHLIHETTKVNEKDEDGNGPLHLAVMCDDTKATEKLLKYHAHLINSKNRAGQTPLHRCAWSDLQSAVQHAKKILEQKPGALGAKDKQGRTASDIASQRSGTAAGRRMRKLLEPFLEQSKK